MGCSRASDSEQDKYRIHGKPTLGELSMPETGQAVLVTGTAGFIGYHMAERLLNAGYRVIGLDSVNDYYDPRIKRARLATLAGRPGWTFYEIDLADRAAVESLFETEKPEIVINLAAQAGVRYSLTNPHAYIDSNVTGFLHILEGCRHHGVKHLLYASSSSVYGANTDMPFSEHSSVNHPLSLYAATKKSNEMMAHTYSWLYDLPTTGLRFFTVYGPWGRPDMALFLFTKAILANEPIDVFNNGEMSRDFTYVDDVTEGIERLMAHTPEGDPAWDSKNPDPARSPKPFRIYNIGNNAPVKLMDMIGALEDCLGQVAEKNYLGMQPGDVPATWADASELITDVGYKPSTSIEIGIEKFVTWYRDYYGV